jgi:hypothetical protein
MVSTVEFLSQSPELKVRWSLSVRPLYEEVMTRSPGLMPLSTSMKSLLRRPSFDAELAEAVLGDAHAAVERG